MTIAVAASQEVYRALGVRTLINASGTVTARGGSLMPQPVLAAMRDAARHFVTLRELQDAAGQRLASLLGVEAALVSSGAAGAILLAAAACLTGDDPAKIARLPDTGGADGHNQFLVIPASRPNYMYQACEAAGARLIEVGGPEGPITADGFASALGPQTAAVFLVVAALDAQRDRTGGAAQLIPAVAAVVNRAGVPLIVDAAAELPPRSNFRQYLDWGASLALFSGGKAIRGPQGSGLLLGRQDLVAAAALNNNPLAAIGRPMKVGKEEIVGLVRAVELFIAADETAELAELRRQAELVVDALSGIPGVSAKVVADDQEYGRPPITPKAAVRLDRADGAARQRRVAAKLMAGNPAIAIGARGTSLVVNPMTLEPGEAEVVAERLRRALIT